ncbi:MAG: methyltransferase [Anaerolineae bacterium]
MTDPIDERLIKTYLKKTIQLSLAGTTLELGISQTLFSSHEVDTGTLHLLKTLQTNVPDIVTKILDLGCGYGPLGLFLAQTHPGSQVHLVDRDALALLFAKHNATANEIAETEVYASLGYDGVTDDDFDLIVSNIPGKAGEAVIEAMLLDAQEHLRETGMVAVVVVSPLESFVEETLTQPGVEIVLHKTMSAHAVFHYRFLEPGHGDRRPAFGRGVYDREALTFVLDDLTFSMHTAQGLPEFDTLSYETELLIKALRDLETPSVTKAVVFNPGQGHIPVILWRLLAPHAIDLVDRDLLSLRTSRMNLIENGCPPSSLGEFHQVKLAPPDTDVDLIVGILRESEGPEAIEYGLAEAALHLRPGGLCLIGGGSTPVTRVLKSKTIARYLRPLKRKRSKGNSTALLRRR